MKHLTKRGLALLLALVLCLSMLPNVTTDASAASYVANWGRRDVVATELSDYAEAFYTGNNTYDTFSQLSGSSSTSSVTSSALYTTLKNFMASKHSYVTSYDATRYLFCYTDCQDGDSTSNKAISSFYSGKGIGPNWDSGNTWNREHTWPNSKGNGSSENDIMMLRPTSVSENSSRGNKAYGESSNYYDPNELGQNVRGDVARIMLYVYVRWGDQNASNMWGQSGVMESKAVLLKWMEEDPVDTWELGRNDAVQSITGTRNVFVDYPELAFLLFNEEIPSDMITPSGEAAEDGFTITPQSSNNAHGTVSLSGNVINAAPAAGYYTAGYEVISGSAAVSQNGNAFTVTASSDCTIRINFAARTAATISFHEAGTQVGSQSLYADDMVNLPDHTGTVPAGYSFLGWVSTAMDETTKTPAEIFAAGAKYTVTTSAQFHALYARLDTAVTGEGSFYTRYTGDVETGDYLIVAENGGMASGITKNRFDYQNITVIGDAVVNPAANTVWRITLQDGYCTIYNAGAGYAASNGTANQARLDPSVTDYAKWRVSADGSDGTYDFVNIYNSNKGINANLRRNSNFGFACYADSTSTAAPYLYQKAHGTVLYGTTAEACIHTNTVNVERQAPTCSAVGYTAGVKCNDCQGYTSGHEEIPAVDHSYSTKVTAPTCTNQGYTTHTCVYGHSYVDTYTNALGHDLGQWRVHKAATATADGEERRTCSRCSHYESRVIQRQGNILMLTGDLLSHSTVWIDGLPYPVQSSGSNRYVELPTDKSCMLVTYTYHVGDAKDVHTQYPTGMKVYKVTKGASGFQAQHIPQLDNLLQYSGSSIRITGTKGIRMITSITKANKAALTGSGLAGYKLVEYGTALCWASELAADGDLVLGKSYTRSNYAYKRGVADPVFATSGNLVQYTNVLVGFNNDQCRDDIAMRPYIILEDSQGNQVTLYGGTVYRSIGYIAYQNRNVFKAGTASYQYVWGIIHHVYGNKYNADYKG